ncbi:MAG: SpoIIE family protein phosphatase [Lachnospiraceae bacterium]
MKKEEINGDSGEQPVFRKRKRSIQGRIISLFILSLIGVALISGWMIYRNEFGRAAHYTKDKAIRSIELARMLLDDMESLENADRESYLYTRSMLRSICDYFGIEYMYVVQKGEKPDTVRFVFCVASDEKEDTEVRATRRYGTIVKRKLNRQEQSAFEGNDEPQVWHLDNNFGNVVSWTMPYCNEEGSLPEAIITVDFRVEDFYRQVYSSFFTTVGFAVVILLGLLAFQILFLRHRVFQPLERISSRMAGFVAGEHLEVEPLGINSGDEMQEISDSFEKMTRDIRGYVENLERITNDRAKEKAQLEIARNIQQGMVPAAYHFQEKTVDAAAFMRPAREIGGDFYDCFIRRDGRLCVLMADVSGKGISAALFMAMAKSMLHQALSTEDSPAMALNWANDDMCSQNPEGLFVTVFAMFLDPGTGKAVFANAGHNPPVLFGAEGTRAYEPLPGIALALFEDAGIEDEEYVFAPGEGILFYTDGITEAVSRDKQFYGFDRLVEFLRGKEASMEEDLSEDVNSAHAKALISMEEILSDVVNSVDAFVDGAEQFDDMTLAAVRFLGAEDSGETANLKGGALEMISKDIEAAASQNFRSDAIEDEGSLAVSLSEFEKLKKRLLSMLEGSSNSVQIVLAAEEAFVNIVSYSGATAIGYECSKAEDFVLTLTDDGVAFDPLAEREEKDFDEFDSGGMGILLIRQIAKKVIYERSGEKNCLTMTFAIDE